VATLLVVVIVTGLRGSPAGTLTNIVVGGATLILVAVTAIYVDLTRDVATSSSAAAASAAAAVEYSRRAMQVNEIRYLAAEFPIVFPKWLRTIKKMHPNSDMEAFNQLAEVELSLRLQVLAMRHRLSANDDYIATELDRAVYAYTGWLDEHEPDINSNEMPLPETVLQACTASLVFITANLPARVREVIETGDYWLGPETSE
jgi:hypothetical protein